MKGRILIVDDSRFSRKVMQDIIATTNYQIVASVTDGLQALDAFKQHQPDLVFLDVTMPNMSGKECLIELMKINPSAKIVMVSALTNPIMMEECLKLGAKGFISKSLESSNNGFEAEVLKTLQQHLAA